MHVVRTLIATFLFASLAQADIQSVILTGSSSAFEPKNTAATVEEKLRNHIKSVSLTANKIEILSNWSVSLEYSRNVANYSQYKVYDFVGTERSLGDDLTEDNVSIDQIVTDGHLIYELVAATNFGTTPLRKSNLSFLLINKIDQENLIGFSLNYQRQNLPQNYFTNPNNGNTREARATVLDTDGLKLNFEHIYTSGFKNRFELSYGRRVQDRPASYGLTVKNLVVLNDDMGLRADIGYLAENEAEGLKTDLGYQSTGWFETKFIHNVSSYWVYGIGYSLEVNREKKPWLSVTDQLGNDQILADIKYDTIQYSVTLALAYAKYNTGQNGTNMKGELEWKF